MLMSENILIWRFGLVLSGIFSSITSNSIPVSSIICSSLIPIRIGLQIEVVSWYLSVLCLCWKHPAASCFRFLSATFTGLTEDVSLSAQGGFIFLPVIMHQWRSWHGTPMVSTQIWSRRLSLQLAVMDAAVPFATTGRCQRRAAAKISRSSNKRMILQILGSSEPPSLFPIMLLNPTRWFGSWTNQLRRS